MKPLNGGGGAAAAEAAAGAAAEVAAWPCFLAPLPCCQQPFVALRLDLNLRLIGPQAFFPLFILAPKHTSQLKLVVLKDGGMQASFVLAPEFHRLGKHIVSLK